jgi:ParB family chromosome partitioning protein
VQKKGLGKGLDALLPDIEELEKSAYVVVETDSLSPNPLQPRRSFDEAKMEELATSVRENGILQPLVVRRLGAGYELIAGERRLRAAIKAGLKEVPVVVREGTDTETLQLALIENLQREDLDPLEEAHAFQRLQEEFGLNQEKIASQVGKSRPAVANSMRLLLLPQQIRQEISSRGRLPVGQARALLGLERDQLIIAAAREVISRGLSARETEALVRRLKSGKQKINKSVQPDPNLTSMLEELQRCLGTRVRLLHGAKSGKGKLEIEYYSNTDLDRIARKILRSS